MKRPPPPWEHGYVVVDTRRHGTNEVGGLRDAIQALEARGWRRTGPIEDIVILTGPRARLHVRQVGRSHFLLGEWRPSSAPLSTLIARSVDPAALARAVVREGWGRYILAWRDDRNRLGLLRDPTGALDCVWWRHGGAVLAVHEPPRELDRILPEELEIDWRVLREIAEAPELLGDRLALKGLVAVNPGTVQVVGPSTAEATTVWRPSELAAIGTGDGSPEGLVAVVDRTVRELAAPHRRLLGEISGGLDSAIVAGGLQATGDAGRTTFLNFHGDRPEGDERAYAQATADRLGVKLITLPKPVRGLSLDELTPLGDSVRPALQGLDVTYDSEVAARMRRERATGLFTGQGGDAVFFQAADPAVVADRFRREGLRALSPGFVGAVARWTRHSSWTVLRHALTARAVAPSEDRRHPWLEDLERLPPAKARQVRQFVNAQLFWGDCLRARAGALLQPLLSQPVVEHCLAVPADRLVAGVRDRGLARQAFAGRLPPSVIHRRSKGDLSHFYGQVTRASLPMLRGLLLDGALAAEGVVDRRALEAELVEARLIWKPGYNRLLVSAVLEVWAQRWKDRIREAGRLRRTAARVDAPALPPPQPGARGGRAMRECGRGDPAGWPG